MTKNGPFSLLFFTKTDAKTVCHFFTFLTTFWAFFTMFWTFLVGLAGQKMSDRPKFALKNGLKTHIFTEYGQICSLFLLKQVLRPLFVTFITLFANFSHFKPPKTIKVWFLIEILKFFVVDTFKQGSFWYSIVCIKSYLLQCGKILTNDERWTSLVKGSPYSWSLENRLNS